MKVIICFFYMLATIHFAKSQQNKILCGADQVDVYIKHLANKSIGLVINHSSRIDTVPLVDSLLSLGINIHTVFTPEHGFSGLLSNGEKIEYRNHKNTFQLVSLYGKNKKPQKSQLSSIDLMVFDIQDVGVRFYTYISTLHYIMEACSENNIPLLILDRPNPNGGYVDGPVLDTTFRSFVGIHPIPIVYGLTIGELAQMINGEKWLPNQSQCSLEIIKVKNWTHDTPYSLPVKPSPNLPNDLSISLYPSLCLFEGTIISVGRGTDYPFQQAGHPLYPDKTHSFLPVTKVGAKYPPYKNQICYGISWIHTRPNYIFSLRPLITIYQKMDTSRFFNDYFNRLAGNNVLQKQIEKGMTADEIKKTWQKKLNIFKKKRKIYLLYD